MKRLELSISKYNEGILRANLKLYKGDTGNIADNAEETSKRVIAAMKSEQLEIKHCYENDLDAIFSMLNCRELRSKSIFENSCLSKDN